jgi:hypothetical protein
VATKDIRDLQAGVGFKFTKYTWRTMVSSYINACAILRSSLSLSLSHTHTHTHTQRAELFLSSCSYPEIIWKNLKKFGIGDNIHFQRHLLCC